MARNVQRKARFAHAGSCADDDKVGAVQARDRVIQFTDTRRDAAVQVFVRRIQAVKAFKRLKQHFVQALKTL